MQARNEADGTDRNLAPRLVSHLKGETQNSRKLNDLLGFSDASVITPRTSYDGTEITHEETKESAAATEDSAIRDPAIEDPALQDPALQDPVLEDPAKARTNSNMTLQAWAPEYPIIT